MTMLKDYIDEELKDPEFARIWEAGELEYRVQKMIISAREDAGITQADLAKAVGMKREAISRLETGNANPTLKTLSKVAKAMGKQIELKFV